MKHIMVRADDLGYSEGVNYGIYSSVKNGLIKNIGFMVNMPYTQHGYDLVKDLDICLGQHTNICVGKPISDPKLIPSIVNENGEFKSSKQYREAKEDFVVLDEVIIEIEAQLAKFREITGRDPEYFEGHAVSSANFFKGLEIVAKKHGLKYLGMSMGGKGQTFNGQPMYMHMESMFQNYNPFESLKKMVENAHEDAYDMMICHPGFLDAYIMKTSSLLEPRVLEVEMLCSPDTKKWLDENNIELYTYDQVK